MLQLIVPKQSSGLLLLAALMFVWPAASVRAQQTQASDDVALGSYDVVSYWSAQGPVRGSNAISAVYNEHVYQFSDEDNRTHFLIDPTKYLPQYDGWCATSLSMGHLSAPDYTNFKIEDGRLLLFEHTGFTNGRTLWDTDPSGFRTRANQHAIELLK